MKILLLSCLLGLSIFSSSAQHYLGLTQSDYSGVMQADKNPGFLADNREKVDVMFGGFQFAGYNNHLYFNPMNMPGGWKASFMDTNYTKHPNFGKIVTFDSTDYYRSRGANFFTFGNPKGKDRNAYVNMNVDIVNVLVTLSEKSAIGFGFKHRSMVNIDDVSENIIDLARTELDYPSLWNIDLDDQLLNISYNSWNEFNFSYAQVLMDDEEHFVKAGLKVKFLKGIASAYVYTDQVDYQFSNEDTAAYMRGDFEYGYSEVLDDYTTGVKETSVNNIMSDFFRGNSKLGLGFDIGGVYEWRPDWKTHKYDMDGETNLWRRDENKYKLRAAFSVSDIGGMRYTKGELSRNFRLDANVLDIDSAFGDISGFRSFDSTIIRLEQEGQLSYIDDKGTYFMNLPTALNFNLDYEIHPLFYLNLDASVAFQMKRDAHKTTYGSHIAFSPRFDHRWFGATIPISYGEYVGFRTGLGLRLGPIFIGTADLKPFLAAGKDWKIKGADIYAALKIPIPQPHPHDRDGDKVSDKVEKKHRKELRKLSGNKKEAGCIDVPGVWEFKGCPDTDGDHIQDSKDSCIYDPGTKEFNGCPDSDNDKIIDKLDDCPQDSGLVEFNGCPDTDMDGIMDKLDSCALDSGLVEFNGCPDRDGDKIIDKLDDCPDEAGLVEFNGCPDRDEDGIKDGDDLCPDHAGPIENEGCPDTDKDGLFDFVDNCPEVAGPQENRGCPWPDTDEDGILDKDDACPNNPGPKSNKGCPYADTDKDGVLDKDDDCVNTPGPKDNNGCPKIDEHIQKILDAAFDNLEFKTGSAIIEESSYESLDSLASLLVDRPTWKLEIAGHTDNVGAASSNLALSKKRAQAVSLYLNQRGVQEDNLIVQFFGEEKPIADNDTKEGRQKNRRVEMTVVFE